jgi:hypothetical protein
VNNDINKGSKVCRVFEWKNGILTSPAPFVSKTAFKDPRAKYLVHLRKDVLPNTVEKIWRVCTANQRSGLVCFMPSAPPENWTHIKINQTGPYSVHGSWRTYSLVDAKEAWKSGMDKMKRVNHQPITEQSS